MAKKKAPLYNVIGEDENVYFEGKPQKLAYIINSCKSDFPKFLFDVLFKVVFIPILLFTCLDNLNKTTTAVFIVFWILYLIPTVLMLRIPILKALEQKNTYYIITDKAVYIQFGVGQIFYRTYPKERIGTKVFYRQNYVDSFFGVGTLGFSVDDYYEERIMSIKNYEGLFTILKDITNSRKEEMIREFEERQAKKKEFEEQARLLAQEELFLQKHEEEEEKKRRERYEREMRESFERERAESERYIREHEERIREERRRATRFMESQANDEADDDDDEKFDRFRRRRRPTLPKNEIRRKVREIDDDDDELEDEEKNEKDLESFDMGDFDTTDRPPSEKVVESYRSRQKVRNAGKKTERKTIKFDTSPNANKEKNKFDMNRLWSGGKKDDA